MSTLRVPPSPPESAPSPPDAPAEPGAIALERRVLGDLARLVADRAFAEAEVERTRATHDEGADRDFAEKRKALEDRFEGTKAAELHEDATRRRAITDASIAAEAAAKDEFARASRKIASEFDAAREQARGDHAKAKARATADFDAGEKLANTQHSAARKPIDDAARLIEARKARIAELYADYKHFGLPEPGTVPTQIRGSHKVEDPIGKVFDRLHKLEPSLALLEGLVIPKSMKGRGFIGIFVVLGVVLTVPLVVLLDPGVGLAVAALLTGVGGYLLKVQLYKLSAAQVGKFLYPVSQALIDCEAMVKDARAAADEQVRADKQKNAAARDETLGKAKQKQAQAIAASEANRDERLRVINEVYANRRVEAQTKLAREMREAVDLHDRRVREIPTQHEAAVRKLDERYQALKERIRAHHQSGWEAMATPWRRGMAEARATLDRVVEEVDAYAPRWDEPSWADRTPPTAVPPLLRIGETRVGLRELPGGISADPSLMEGIGDRFDFPALLPFPDRANLLVEAPASGRAAAIATLQATMFRC